MIEPTQLKLRALELANGDLEAAKDIFGWLAPPALPPAPAPEDTGEGEPVHASDCALHNGPALEPGDCDCEPGSLATTDTEAG